MRQTPRQLEDMFAFGDPPNYSPAMTDSFGERAKRTGTSMWELAYDALLERDGTAMIIHPAANFARGNLDASLEMMRHKDTVVGLGDGGAHVARICDASIPTHIMSYWTRDRQGDRLDLATAVRMLTHDTAEAVGLLDRGVIAPGYRADLNVIDADRVGLRQPRLQQDLPAGGSRLVQDAEGYVATFVNGTATFRDGRATGAYPGRLVRGTRST
jgi:N-acyl-D-aspartate/D-glutamate deacylase